MSFYCKYVIGDPDFSIEEWNKAYKEINAMPISEAEKEKLITGNTEQCKEQCFDCMAIVGERQLKTKLILIDAVEKVTNQIIGK
jgi:hypothetical protein